VIKRHNDTWHYRFCNTLIRPKTIIMAIISAI